MALHLADEFVQQRAKEKARMDEQSKLTEITTQLEIMGYDNNYIQRAIEIHRKSKFGSNWNASLLVEIIMRLKDRESKSKKTQPRDDMFTPHFQSMQQAERLNINDLVDYRYENGRFILCRIIEKNLSYHEHTIKVHPLGRPLSDTKYDKHCNIAREYSKLAPAKSVSLRCQQQPSNLQVDDYIDVNPVQRAGAGHAGWKSGRIIKLDAHSSQIKVLYHNEVDHKNYSYWVHLENTQEVAQFRTKCQGVDQHQMQAEFEQHAQRRPTVDMSHVRYSVLEREIAAYQHSPNHSSSFSNSRHPSISIVNAINNGFAPPPQHPVMFQSHSNQSSQHSVLSPLSQYSQHSPHSAHNQYSYQHVAQQNPAPAAHGMNGYAAAYSPSMPSANSAYDFSQSGNINEGAKNPKAGKFAANANVIGDDFNNQISSVSLGNQLLLDDIVDDMAGNNRDAQLTPMGPVEPTGIPPPPFFHNEHAEPQRKLSSMAPRPIPKIQNMVKRDSNSQKQKRRHSKSQKLSNEFHVEMSNNDYETAKEAKGVHSERGNMQQIKLHNSNSDEIEHRSVIAKASNNHHGYRSDSDPLLNDGDENKSNNASPNGSGAALADNSKIATMQQTVAQLQQLGYHEMDILAAMHNVSDQSNINEIIDYIQQQTTLTSPQFKVRQAQKAATGDQNESVLRFKLYDPNDHKHDHDEHIDVDAIAFEDNNANDNNANDDEDDDGVVGDMTTPMDMGEPQDDDLKDDQDEHMMNGNNGFLNNGRSRQRGTSAIDREPQNLRHYTKTDKTSISRFLSLQQEKQQALLEEDENEADAMTVDCLSVFAEDDKVSAFVPCMSMDRIESLREMELIDHRNPLGKFCRAKVVAKDEKLNRVKIEYIGFNSQHVDLWDGWSAISLDTQHLFARYQSISRRKCNQWKFRFLQVGSLVELRPSAQRWHELDVDHAYFGWQCAQIVDCDTQSGQVLCKYEHKEHSYLYWVHVDNEQEISYIDNSYDVGDTICVFHNTRHQWMIATVREVEMNCIVIEYSLDGNKQQTLTETVHVIFDEKRLIFPTLLQDIQYVQNAISREKLKWKLITVTPTNHTIYQCFAYMMYGDLNQASNVKQACLEERAYGGKEEKEKEEDMNGDDEYAIISTLCRVYSVRLRVFQYNMDFNRLDICYEFDRGVDDLNMPIILLSKHLDKFYNIIVDQASLDKIPYTHI